MNQKQMNTVGPNARTAGSKTLKLGALTGVVALAAALAITLAPRGVSADPLLEPMSRPQLSGEASVQSVMRYIALHANDVAGSRSVDPNVDSVNRYIEAHRVDAARGLSAEALAVQEYLEEHGVKFGQASAAANEPRGLSANEQAVINYLRDHGVKFGQ